MDFIVGERIKNKHQSNNSDLMFVKWTASASSFSRL